MKIAITGGKGGTGKSTVATALAVRLARKHRVLLLDLDVDCPDDHLLLSIKRQGAEDIMQFVPKIDFKKCIKCGKCARTCRESAIVFVQGRYPILVPEQCTGCGACWLVCPAGAIGKTRRKIGTIYKGRGHGIDFIGGELELGYEEASPIVNAVRRFSEKIEKRYDYVLIDTAAGTHCNVISAMLGVDMALAVTEPTPLGQHDLELILELLKVLEVPSKIVLNRSDIGDKALIKEVSRKFKTDIIAEIPYRKDILEAYSRGKPVTGKGIEKIAEFLEDK